MPVSLPHDDVKPFSDSGKGKKEQIAEMFDRISGGYDFMNRFLSGRMDIGWRKKAIRVLGKEKPKHILDIATGTGDMAIMAAKRLSPEQITGIDISEKMIDVGKQKIEKENLTNIIQLQKGDAETINFAENSFDAGMVAFGIRNFENLEKGLLEIARVIKPGGKLVILEFSKPKQPFRFFYNIYCGWVAPALASLFNMDKEAYQYLNNSIQAFPERQALISILKSSGFKQAGYRPLSFGICCIYTAIK